MVVYWVFMSASIRIFLWCIFHWRRFAWTVYCFVVTSNSKRVAKRAISLLCLVVHKHLEQVSRPVIFWRTGHGSCELWCLLKKETFTIFCAQLVLVRILQFISRCKKFFRKNLTFWGIVFCCGRFWWAVVQLKISILSSHQFHQLTWETTTNYFADLSASKNILIHLFRL